MRRSIPRSKTSMPAASAGWPTPVDADRRLFQFAQERQGDRTGKGGWSLGKLVQVGARRARTNKLPVDQDRLRRAADRQSEDGGDPSIAAVGCSGCECADHGAKPYQVVMFSRARAEP